MSQVGQPQRLQGQVQRQRGADAAFGADATFAEPRAGGKLAGLALPGQRGLAGDGAAAQGAAQVAQCHVADPAGIGLAQVGAQAAADRAGVVGQQVARVQVVQAGVELDGQFRLPFNAALAGKLAAGGAHRHFFELHAGGVALAGGAQGRLLAFAHQGGVQRRAPVVGQALHRQRAGGLHRCAAVGRGPLQVPGVGGQGDGLFGQGIPGALHGEFASGRQQPALLERQAGAGETRLQVFQRQFSVALGHCDAAAAGAAFAHQREHGVERRAVAAGTKPVRRDLAALHIQRPGLP